MVSLITTNKPPKAPPISQTISNNEKQSLHQKTVDKSNKAYPFFFEKRVDIDATSAYIVSI